MSWTAYLERKRKHFAEMVHLYQSEGIAERLAKGVEEEDKGALMILQLAGRHTSNLKRLIPELKSSVEDAVEEVQSQEIIDSLSELLHEANALLSAIEPLCMQLHRKAIKHELRDICTEVDLTNCINLWEKRMNLARNQGNADLASQANLRVEILQEKLDGLRNIFPV